MVEAVTYCHSHNVCHRDLKLDNWVYKDANNTTLKLIDFGFSRDMKDAVGMTAYPSFLSAQSWAQLSFLTTFWQGTWSCF